MILAMMPVAMGMSIVVDAPPAVTLFSIVIVTVEPATVTETPSTALMFVSMPSGRLAPPGRVRVIEPWADADAGVPHGRRAAPMLKVIAGVTQAGVTHAVPGQ